MSKVFVAVMVVAVILLAPLGLGYAAEPPGGVTVGGKYYPPCKSRADDSCLQVRGAPEMRMEMGKPSEKARMRQKMGEPMMRLGPPPPHGCSPVTTPCKDVM